MDTAKMKKPSRVSALLLGFVGPGLGQAYLGQWRRAALWAFVPFPLFLCYTALLMRLRWSAAYGSFLPGAFLFWLGWFVARSVDVFVIPEDRIRAVPAARLFALWLGAIVSLVALSFVNRTFFVEAFKIPAGSMAPTLVIQDHTLVDKAAFRGTEPKRGELAVFVSPEHPEQDYVKRIVALAGDHLVVRHGRVWLNDWSVPYCRAGDAVRSAQPGEEDQIGELGVEFLGEHAYLTFLDQEHGEPEQGPFTVPAGEVYVLGDNRNNSFDSRFWFGGRGGGVPIASLLGVPRFLWLSFDASGQVNWQRIGASLDKPLLAGWPEPVQKGLRKCLADRPAQTLPPVR